MVLRVFPFIVVHRYLFFIHLLFCFRMCVCVYFVGNGDGATVRCQS